MSSKCGVGQYKKCVADRPFTEQPSEGTFNVLQMHPSHVKMQPVQKPRARPADLRKASERENLSLNFERDALSALAAFGGFVVILK
jgi:hypothetical protein